MMSEEEKNKKKHISNIRFVYLLEINMNKYY